VCASRTQDHDLAQPSRSFSRPGNPTWLGHELVHVQGYTDTEHCSTCGTCEWGQPTYLRYWMPTGSCSSGHWLQLTIRHKHL
jgi:hypothetical protein